MSNRSTLVIWVRGISSKYNPTASNRESRASFFVSPKLETPGFKFQETHCFPSFQTTFLRLIFFILYLCSQHYPLRGYMSKIPRLFIFSNQLHWFVATNQRSLAGNLHLHNLSANIALIGCILNCHFTPFKSNLNIK